MIDASNMNHASLASSPIDVDALTRDERHGAPECLPFAKPAAALVARPENRELVSRAISLLARRDMTRAALIVKLLKEGFERGECEAVCRWCEGKGFLDERRHAEGLALRLQKRYGSHRVAQVLRQKGATESAIEEAVREVGPGELARARTLLARKFPDEATSAQERAKRQRFLARRGFPGFIIRDAIKASGGKDD